MKLLRIIALLLLATYCARAADVKISDLTAATTPSTNTFIEIADMSDTPKSKKALFYDMMSTYLGDSSHIDFSTTAGIRSGLILASAEPTLSKLYINLGIVSTNITASRLLVTDGVKNITNSAVTATEAGYLSGVSSALQTQLNARVTTNAAIEDSISIPMGAWRTNDVLDGASITAASAVGYTNVADSFAFTDGVTNAIRVLISPPIGWDAGVIRVVGLALCTGTNDPAATNVVWSIRAAAVNSGDTANAITMGTAVTLTNRISISANVARVFVSNDITVGNTPASTSRILLEIQRLGAATADTMTNTSVRLIDTKLLFKKTLNAAWASPSS